MSRPRFCFDLNAIPECRWRSVAQGGSRHQLEPAHDAAGFVKNYGALCQRRLRRQPHLGEVLDGQAVSLRQFLQRDLWACTDVLDDFRRSEPAELSGILVASAA